VNLYESGEATLQLDDSAVAIRQTSLYPDFGKVIVEFHPEAPVTFTLRLRIPPSVREVQFKLNRQAVLPDSSEDGYFGFRRIWSQGDSIAMEFDVPVTVKDFLGAHYGIIVRGPEVLAVDQQDNPALDLDRITLREQIILNSISAVN